MSQQIKIVLGSLFGDEGKGNTVQYLCKQAIAEGHKPLVIRYCGGPQSGHRVVHNGISHVGSSFGSGVLLGVPTLYVGTSNCFIDPISLQIEKEELINKGLNPELYICGQPSIITPYDVMVGRNSSKILNDGSCGKGIYPTFYRYSKQANLYNPDYFSFDDQLNFVTRFWNLESDEETNKKWIEAVNKLNFLNPKEYGDFINQYDVLIFEGTQGLLLDMECGFMPHCTPSKVGLNGIHKDLLLLDTEVYLVTRTYLTRHGNGYEPFSYGLDEYMNVSYEPSNLDDGYQGIFKKGLFEVPLLLRAFDRHHLDNYNVKYNLVLTHCDCINNKLIPFTDYDYCYNCLEIDLFVNSIVKHSCINFNKILYFDNEEM